MLRSRRVRLTLTGIILFGVSIVLLNCSATGGGSGDTLVLPEYATVIPLTANEVLTIIVRAAEAVDAPNMTVAVVDRVGRPLGIWSRTPGVTEDEVNLAVSVARTGAFMSSSQGPITSTTLEYISTFHFPPVFGAFTRMPVPNSNLLLDPTLAPQRETLDVAGTPQGPLWQIFSSNRGAPFAGMDLTNAGLPPHTLFVPGNEIPAPGRVDINGNAIPNVPGVGLTYLNGGISIYKSGDPTPFSAPDPNNPSALPPQFLQRVVGGVGVWVTEPGTNQPRPDIAEFAAIQALEGTGNFGEAQAMGTDPLNDPSLNFLFPFSIVPPDGLIFLVGERLPYVTFRNRPAGVGPGMFVMNGILRTPIAGLNQAFGWIIGPRADPDNPNGLTQAEVQQLIDQGIDAANGTRAAIRVPAGSATKMVFAVTNQVGRILGAFRMEDSPIFSYDVSVTKARCVTYYSSSPGGNPNMAPVDAARLNTAGMPTGLPGTAGEFGVALTTRTFAFLTQPFFPPGIDSSPPAGPLVDYAVENADPNNWQSVSVAVGPDPGLQSGIIFFPGATPLYKNGQLIGGFGVSGDGVEEDDIVTAFGYQGFEGPQSGRADNFFFDGVRLPYFKFPNQPGGGGN